MSLAPDSITVTDQPSGVEHATVVIGSKHYPVVLVADQQGHYRHDVYVASALAMSKGISKNYLSVYNADPTLKVEIVAARVAQEITAAGTGLVRGYRLFRFTTAHSSGTALTARQLDTAAPALDADITARANGQTIGGAEAEALAVVSLNEEETGAGGAITFLFDEKQAGAPIVLNQNQGVVIQQDSTAGVGVLSAAIYFRVR
jgi:hypothetical protein